jgi:dynactin 1
MDKRMEGVKRQADSLAELEGELAKIRKQEKAYEQTIEALHGDLSGLEKENVKLKQQSATVVDRGKTGECMACRYSAHAKGVREATSPASATLHPASLEAEVLAFTGSLETSQLLQHIEHLKASLRFLRQENAFLKSQDLLADLQSLPSLPVPREASDEYRSVQAETKQLWREALQLTAMPRVVDLTAVDSDRTKWSRKARRAEYQLEAQQARFKGLAGRIQEVGLRVEALPRMVALRG